jgi:hypothetical protein
LSNVHNIFDVWGQAVRFQVNESVHLELGVLLLCADPSFFLGEIAGLSQIISYTHTEAGIFRLR